MQLFFLKWEILLKRERFYREKTWLRSVNSPLVRLNTRKCCICKINNKPVWHDLFYITKHSAIITISIRLSVYDPAVVCFFLPSKSKKRGKTGRGNYKTCFLFYLIKKGYTSIISAHILPLFSFSWGREIKFSHKSILSIIPTIRYEPTPDNYYQLTTTINHQQNILNLTTQIQTVP